MASNTIYKQLRAAQLELKAPKNQDGRFGKSRSAEAILEAAKPVLNMHELTLIVTDEIRQVGERNYVKATAIVFNDQGESASASAEAWEGEVDRGLDASQVTGKTSSYARKYALGGLLAIDDTKDADTYKDADTKATKPKLTELQKAKVDLLKDMQSKGMSKDGIEVLVFTALNKNQIESLADVKKVRDLLAHQDDAGLNV